MSTTTLVRRFKFGSTILPDPDPTLSPEQVLAFFSPNYPFLASARLAEPVVEGDTLVYGIEKPAATTKGRRKSAAQEATEMPALSALRAWAEQPAENIEVGGRWAKVFSFTLSLAEQPARPLRDALLIPLA